MKKHLLMLFAAVTAVSMSLNAQTILIDDGFENGIQDSVWTQEFVEGHTAWAVEDIADGISHPATVKQGSKRAYLRNTTGETQGYVTRLVSKVMDLRPNKVYQPQLSFWYANPKWADDRDTLRVLYRTAQNAKWKQLAEYSTASSNWQYVKIELPEPGEVYQIAFEGTDNLGRGIVLDSVKLRSAPECTVLRDIPAAGQKVRYSLAQFAGKHVRIGFYREAKSNSATGIAVHVDNVRLAYFDKTAESTSGCQYEEIQVGDITLPDDAAPGIHTYPVCFYASDADALAGKRDSVHAIEIEIFPTPETIYKDTICAGETYSGVDFVNKDKGGIYRRKLQTVEHGCDSIVSLHLHMIPRAYAEDEIVALCPGETYTWNGKVYNRNGLFRDTTVSAAGCDSIETLVLSYYDAEKPISDGIRITQDELPFTYQNEDYPYAAGQAPIYYPVGTPVGRYTDTVLVMGENCVAKLAHVLIITQSQGLDDIDAEGRGARKVLYRDNLYIILNDEWYNAEGKKVGDPRE